MKFAQINKKLFSMFGFYLVAAMLVAVLADWSIRTTIEKSKIISLSSQATADLSAEQLKCQDLKNQVSKQKKSVEVKERLRYPTLRELKDKATEHRLSLRQIEKGSQSAQSKTSAIKYVASFVGGMTSQVLFLKDIESQYLVDTDGLVVKAADEKGEKVSMTISLLISE